jgi:ubiquinone/menaquinone biosynthesis C-methylase UbiE
VSDARRFKDFEVGAWDQRSATYDLVTGAVTARVGEVLLDDVGAGAGVRLLDLGCGPGTITAAAAARGAQATGCDLAAGMLALARERHPTASFVEADAEELPFADASFDVVACRTAAHHFADPAGAVAEMARVSADRVLLVDTEFMGEQVEQAEALRDPSHVRNYTEAEWRGFAEAAGLRVEEVRHFEHSFDLDAWLARTGCEGEDAERAVELLGERAHEGRLTLRKIAILAVTG